MFIRNNIFDQVWGNLRLSEIICKCKRVKNVQGENNYEMLVYKMYEFCVFFYD